MSIWIHVFLGLLIALFIAKLLYLMATGWVLPVTRGALFIPTYPQMVKAFLEAVPMSSQDLFVDLGCGDGRVLRAARKRYGVRAMGFEVNPFAYFLARIGSISVTGIQIKWKDFWKEDLSRADVVFCYLFPDVLSCLRKKLESELHTGSMVVSCNFPFPGWNPLKVLHPLSSTQGDPIYIYRLPESCDT